MTIGLVSFAMIAVVCLGSAVMVALTRHPLRAVIWLVPAAFSAAVLIGSTGAWLMAFLMLLVFAGGVLLPLAVIAVMPGLDAIDLKQAVQNHRPLISALSLLVAVEVVLAGCLVFFPIWPPTAPASEQPGLASLLITGQFALLLLGGLVLIVAMASAIHLTIRQRSETAPAGIAARLYRGQTASSDERPAHRG